MRERPKERHIRREQSGKIRNKVTVRRHILIADLRFKSHASGRELTHTCQRVQPFGRISLDDGKEETVEKDMKCTITRNITGNSLTEHEKKRLLPMIIRLILKRGGNFLNLRFTSI